MGLHPLIALMCGSGILFFVLIAFEVASRGGLRLDARILIALRTPGDLAKPIGPPWMLQSAIDLSALGGFTFVWLFTAATSGYLALIRRWSALGIFLAAIVGASVLNALVKFSFHRARPEVVPHLAEVSNASFPSGHAMISAATYMTVGALLAHTQPSRAVRIYLLGLAAILSILIGLSRLYLGVHWPSDVLAGWTFGSAWALAFWILSRRVEQAVGGSA
jgi:undecaprenyl-diphosphatase